MTKNNTGKCGAKQPLHDNYEAYFSEMIQGMIGSHFGNLFTQPTYTDKAKCAVKRIQTMIESP